MKNGARGEESDFLLLGGVGVSASTCVLPLKRDQSPPTTHWRSTRNKPNLTDLTRRIVGDYDNGRLEARTFGRDSVID
jgi:hypothetical protein